MSVRWFCKSDIQQCKKLWKSAFDDDDRFCDFYFSKATLLADAFVYEYKGAVVGYLASFPFLADYKAVGKMDCRYLYGISVFPEHRGNGFMKALMSAEADEFRCPKLLIPTVENLYEKFGFSYVLKKTTTNIVNENKTLSVNEEPEFLNEIYDCYRKRFDFSLARSPKWWEIIIADAKRYGWSFAANDGAYAVVKDGHIKELAYVSDFYRDTLCIGNGVLELPCCMSNISLKGSSYVAMMLD